MADSIIVSDATEEDIPAILGFIRGLAEYEHLTHQLEVSESLLRETLFGRRRYAEVLMARLEVKPVGFALYFHNYSTFLGRPGIYLEDLFVMPEYRGRGVGNALLVKLAQIACERKCGRLEWTVLDWNQPAIEFYRGIGAAVLPDWRICRMNEKEIAALAGRTQPGG